jgi:ABC-type nitrate/sulfonate/bicarbonate transport system permease component
MPCVFERLAPPILAAASLAAMLLLWEAGGLAGWLDPVLVPRPSLIIATLADLVSSGDVFAPLAHTLALFAAGYSIACILGIGLGTAMATSPTFYGLLEPPVEIIRPIPKPALVPALFLFLGIGKATMVTVVVLAAVFPILINTLQGVRGLDPVLVDTARTFQTSWIRTIFAVVLPGALPMIFAGMRIGLGLGLVLVILAEMLAGETGIGFLILDLQRSFQIREMFAWIFLLALLGGGLTLAFDLLEKRFVPWRGRG